MIWLLLVLDIDLIVTNTIFVKRYKKLYPESIDTLNSQSGQNLNKLQDLLQTLLIKITIFSCAPGLWPGAQLYIWGMSMSRCLTDCLTV